MAEQKTVVLFFHAEHKQKQLGTMVIAFMAELRRQRAQTTPVAWRVQGEDQVNPDNRVPQWGGADPPN